MRWIALASSLLALAACRTPYPVAAPTPPCAVPPFPAPTSAVRFEHCPTAGVTGDRICTSPEGAADLSAWVDAVASWRDAVLACPGVKTIRVAPTVPAPAVQLEQPSLDYVYAQWDVLYHGIR